MTVPKMIKNHKDSNDLKLIKVEEEASVHTHPQTETINSKRGKGPLCYAVLIGMIMLAYYLILLGWQKYNHQSNDKAPLIYIDRIPMFHMNDLSQDINDIRTPGNIHNNIYRRRRSTQTVIGLQSQNVDSNKKDQYNLHEFKQTSNGADNFLSTHNYLYEESDGTAEMFLKIIENEQIDSKVNQNHFEHKCEDEQLENVEKKSGSCPIREEIEKQFVSTNIHSHNKAIGSNKAESTHFKMHNVERENHYGVPMTKYSRNENPLVKDMSNNTLGLSYSIVLACGLLLILIVAMGLCIKFLLKSLSRRKSRKHKRLEEVNEINSRLDPLNYCLPLTPIEKDLRFKENVKKFELFCDIMDK